MTSTSTSTSPDDAGQRWRGVAADDLEEISAVTSAKLAGRSRRLLVDLLRPHRKPLRLMLVAVVIENTARLSIPLLVAKGIDLGIPPIREHDDLKPLVVVVAIVLAATL